MSQMYGGNTKNWDSVQHDSSFEDRNVSKNSLQNFAQNLMGGRGQFLHETQWGWMLTFLSRWTFFHNL